MSAVIIGISRGTRGAAKDRVRGCYGGTADAEHIGGTILQLAAPLCHPAGMRIVLLRDLGGCLVAFDCVQGHLDLECR